LSRSGRLSVSLPRASSTSTLIVWNSRVSFMMIHHGAQEALQYTSAVPTPRMLEVALFRRSAVVFGITRDWKSRSLRAVRSASTGGRDASVWGGQFSGGGRFG
jgi:hypothetical protein